MGIGARGNVNVPQLKGKKALPKAGGFGGMKKVVPKPAPKPARKPVPAVPSTPREPQKSTEELGAPPPVPGPVRAQPQLPSRVRAKPTVEEIGVSLKPVPSPVAAASTRKQSVARLRQQLSNVPAPMPPPSSAMDDTENKNSKTEPSVPSRVRAVPTNEAEIDILN